MDSVEESFVENVPLKNVQNSLKHIPASLKADLGKFFRKESLEAESIKELFITLSCYWDYAFSLHGGWSCKKPFPISTYIEEKKIGHSALYNH